jgi:hypothetical protein
MKSDKTIAIITGDIVNSRHRDPQQWLGSLKDVLNTLGDEPQNWETYRGDSFQLEIDPILSLRAAMLIKATMRQCKGIDVKVAIGIGVKSFSAGKVTESNGTAFIYSGECFEQLKKRKLGIKSSRPSFDIQMNLMLDLAMLTANTWTTISAKIFKSAMENPNFNQNELALMLQTTQSNVSQGLKRSGYYEIVKLLHYFDQLIQVS